MKKNDMPMSYIYAGDLKKSAIKRIMKDLGYEGCDPARFDFDKPDTMIAVLTYRKEEKK